VATSSDEHARTESPVKIATYNVNSVNARLPVLLRWLAETQPDVACLQELKAAQEKFPADALLGAGYHAIWHGQKAWNGVAILARTTKPTETGRCPQSAGDRRDRSQCYGFGRREIAESTRNEVRFHSRLFHRPRTAAEEFSRPKARLSTVDFGLFLERGSCRVR
jgi:exonuclease III